MFACHFHLLSDTQCVCSRTPEHRLHAHNSTQLNSFFSTIDCSFKVFAFIVGKENENEKKSKTGSLSFSFYPHFSVSSLLYFLLLASSSHHLKQSAGSKHALTRTICHRHEREEKEKGTASASFRQQHEIIGKRGKKKEEAKQSVHLHEEGCCIKDTNSTTLTQFSVVGLH